MKSNQLVAVAAVATAAAASNVGVAAFSAALGESRLAAQSERQAWGRPSSSRSQLLATVYFPSDWVEDEEDEDGSSNKAPAAAIPSVLSTQAWTAPLARLAAGHWDGGNSLRKEHIEQVSVRAVAESHVDIEAIVCEDDGCVSLSVPVPFAQSCGGSFGAKFEECILRNMVLLDDEQLEASDGVLTEQEAVALRSTDNVEYPQWWVHPKTLAMSRECSTLMNILNEPDFESDLLGMVQHEMRILLGSDDGIALQKAAVAAVGPAGLVLRAYALYHGEAEVVPVPVPFSVPVTDVSQMRDAVLDCVESINPPLSP